MSSGAGNDGRDDHDGGLGAAEAAARLVRYGPNSLPQPRPPTLIILFFRQFLSPLIYVLVAAVVVSLALGDLEDAVFIGIVLLVNGIVGTTQEYSAGHAAAGLRRLEQPVATVIRDHAVQEIAGRALVPGDLVLLEAGQRVPADLRLVETAGLQCDESLLTGESRAVDKVPLSAAAEPQDRARGTAFAGSVVARGRGRGIVSATGAATEIGRVAGAIGMESLSRPPLLIRLERFAQVIAATVGVAVALLIAVGLLRGMPFYDLFLMAVGLAVSAIPEGLPVAVSVALAIAMRRMAGAKVIVRTMPAVESLGSCTVIATDKTGTLTLNQLTVTDILLPDGLAWVCPPDQSGGDAPAGRLEALLTAAALPNEARLVRSGDRWHGIGDRVDVALLSAAQRGGLAADDLRARFPLAGRIPYEPDLRYAASFHHSEGAIRIAVKGAPETLIAMADHMAWGGAAVPIDRDHLLAQVRTLAQRGLKVLAFAEGEVVPDDDGAYGHRHLTALTFLGLAGMQDPIRPEVPAAIADCRRAGIAVVMVTGDDPRTAQAIAAQAGLDVADDRIVTGVEVKAAADSGPGALDDLTRRARLYARVEPTQKLAIVLSLARNGQFVAVTGDGINDAPALKHAHVGVAMGRSGTEVAKDSADIVIADDNFASIVAGIREGRVAYGNIRKVIFMLVSTGAAEVVLFLLAMPLGIAMPLLPVQLLWLNLVTNGIQDVTLAAERAEGDELHRPPRRPGEAIFDRMMIRRVLQSAAVMGGGGFAVFLWLLDHGYSEAAARNMLLLLLVLFENFQVFNSRSERCSVFRQGLLSNPMLALGALGAQALHIAAMYVPGLSDVLQLSPVSAGEWATLLAVASTLLVVMEFEKWWGRRRGR